MQNSANPINNLAFLRQNKVGESRNLPHNLHDSPRDSSDLTQDSPQNTQDSQDSTNDSPDSPTILSLKNISFKYESDFVLKNINFAVNKGDFIALIGPNGGGKTTLAKILLGLLKPSSGEIIYPNVTLFNKNSLIGYTSQESNINKDFPIQAFDIVLMGFLQAKTLGYKITKTNKLEARKIMEILNIWHIKDKKIGSLSGGQRQRVMIARALCGNPKLMIFDEPTANIDMPTQKEIYQLLKQINANHTIILISHDISVLEYANKVLFVNCEILSQKQS